MSRAIGDQTKTRSRFGLVLKILLGFVALTCVTTPCGLGFVAMKAYFGNADLHVYHRGGGGAELMVDGAFYSRVEQGFATVMLPRGDHVIAARIDATGQEAQWELPGVTGLDHYVLSTDPNTCFASLDVTHALYSHGPVASGIGRPAQCAFDDSDVRVICTHGTFAELDGSMHFDIGELPESVSGSHLVFLLVPIPCGRTVASLSGAALLREALRCP